MFSALLATLYVTFVVVEAEIASAPRVWLAERSLWIATLLSCWRCCALWAAAFVIFVGWLPVIGEWIVSALAAAGAVLLLWPLWKGLENYVDRKWVWIPGEPSE